MKSYGRAPTFLMLTGYEQARSVVSAIAGDWEAARRVELVLPETGVCSSDRELAPHRVAAGPPPPRSMRRLPSPIGGQVFQTVGSGDRRRDLLLTSGDRPIA